MKPARYPLPVWLITDCQGLRTASGGVYRATIAIAVAYWQSGCRPIPADDVTHAALARLPIAGWRQQKPEILAAFATCKDALDEAWAERQRVQEMYMLRSRQMQAARKASAALQRQLAGRPKPGDAAVAPIRDYRPPAPRPEHSGQEVPPAAVTGRLRSGATCSDAPGL